MLKYASHLTSAIAFMASLIECTNVAAQEAGSTRAKYLPSFYYVQLKTGQVRSAAENEAERSRKDIVREKIAEGGAALNTGQQQSDEDLNQSDSDVASILDALAQLRRKHKTESRRVAETTARRKAEEKPLLKAWSNFERKAEEVRRILAGASAEVKAKLAAKANTALKAEEARILAAWADLRRKADQESRNAAEAAAKRKAREAHLLAALARAKRAAIPRSTKSAREREVRAAPSTGAVGVVPAPVPASRAPEQVELINRSLSRGRKFIKLGRFNEGRLFLERAADAGSSEGAFELAESYDPTVLQELGVVGVVSDKMLAAKWYRRAGDLGANGTKERTNRLSAR